MIHLIFVQYTKHRMQITQELSELWFDDKLCEIYATNDFTIVRR